MVYSHYIGNCNSCIAFNYSLQAAEEATDMTDTRDDDDKVAEQKEAHALELDELTATYEGWSERLCASHLSKAFTSEVIYVHR